MDSTAFPLDLDRTEQVVLTPGTRTLWLQPDDELRPTNGDVRLEDCTGSIDASTGSGEITRVIRASRPVCSLSETRSAT